MESLEEELKQKFYSMSKLDGSVVAILAFIEKRKLREIGMVNMLSDDIAGVIEYESNTGKKKTYISNKPYLCEELMDFMAGYLQVGVEVPSSSYLEGVDEAKKPAPEGHPLKAQMFVF